jgi:RNA polymerase sigma-70 factor (ECF subfamily)
MEEDSSQPGLTAGKTSAEHWHRLSLQIAAGREEALGDLYDLVGGRLYGMALWRTGNREDARDVVQEVFVRLGEKRTQLKSVRDPLSWLLTVTHRAGIDVIRRRKVRQAEPLASQAELVSTPPDLGRRVDARRASALLRELPPRQREVLYLRHFEDLTFSQIGLVVGAPTFTTASRYRLGIKKLRRLLESKDEAR